MSSPERSQRSDTSFERLYRAHRRDVYGAVLRDLRDPDEAEDVTQIAFLNAYRAMRRGEEPEKPQAWLVTIARNVCRRRYRALASRPQEVRFDPEVTAAVADVDGPTAGEIVAAVRRLPPNQRAAILLREIQGRSYAEIAAELDLSVAAVETLIFRARGRLSDLLESDERVPATQKRRAFGLFALPLPGFGKLGSLGFSMSRVGIAALVGGVAIVSVPIGSVGAEPEAPPSAPNAPSLVRSVAMPAHPVHQLTPAVTSGKNEPARVQHGGQKKGPAAGGQSTDKGELPALPLPAPLPDPNQIQVPALPIQPPPLQPPPLPLPLPPPPALLPLPPPPALPPIPAPPPPLG